MESVRVRVGVVLCAALAALAFAAAPAQATVSNLIATNESGEPLDESIVTVDVNESIWAYVTTTTGAIICVHPEPVTAGSSCDEDGVWGVSGASAFFAGNVPVTVGNLKPGTWRLIATSKLGAYGTSSLENVS